MFSAVCWGSTGLFIRPLTASGFNSFEIAEGRSIVVAVSLFSFLLLARRDILKLRLKDLWIFIGMGFIGNALMSIFYFYTVDMIALSAASVLLYTSPYMVMVMSAFMFKERITPQKVSALIIAFTGCVMTVGIIGGGSFSKKCAEL